MALCAGLVGGGSAQAAPPKPTGLKTQVGPTAVVVSWTPVKGATSYRVQVSSSASFDEALLDQTTTNTRATPTEVVPTGKLFWRVAAVTVKGTSTWATATFNRAQRPGPILVEPASGVVLDQPEHPPVLRWDPVPGAVSYTVEIDGEEADWVDTETYDTRTTAVVPTETQQPGTYWWRVRAVLGADVNTKVSGQRSYTIGPLPTVSLGSTPPTMEEVVLEWDPVPGAASYEIRVSTDNGFNVITDQRIVSGTRYSPQKTYDNASYWWQVRARDVFGQSEEWPVYPDRTGEFQRTWPEKPALVQPADGAAVAGDLTLQWKPVPLATSYLVDLGSDPGFSDDRYFNTCPTTQTTYTPGYGRGSKLTDHCMPDPGTVYWRVRAVDGTGRAGVVNGRLSDVRSFTWAPPAASTSTLGEATGERISLEGNGTSPCTTPLGSGAGVCSGVTQTPMLDWDPAPGAAYYLVYLAHDAHFTNMVDGYGDFGNPSTLQSTVNTRFAPLAALPDTQAGEAYYWFVRACDKTARCGLTPEVASNAFQKKSVPVAPLSPADGAVVGDQVTFDWTDYLESNQAASDPSTREHPTQAAQSYRIQVAQNSSFAGTREEKVFTEVVDQTTFTAFEDAYPEGVLYWRVQALDGSGNGLTWSPVRQFTKASPLPEATSPSDGGLVNGVQPFRWKPRLYSSYYDLEVYRNNDVTASPANRALWGTNIRQTAFTSEEPLQALGKDFVWRVRRTDFSGNKSAWGAWHRFRVAPAPSKLLEPGRSVSATRPLFSWRAAGPAASYQWQLRRGSDLERVSTVATSYAPTAALARGTYSWRVLSFDADRNQSGATGWRKVVAK
jgi:hypothetical protein